MISKSLYPKIFFFTISVFYSPCGLEKIFGNPLFPRSRDLDAYQENSAVDQAKIQEIIKLCKQVNYRDIFCNVLMDFERIGFELSHFLRELLPLGPLEYVLVSVYQYSFEGRLIYRMPTIKKIEWQIEYYRNRGFYVTIQRKF